MQYKHLIVIIFLLLFSGCIPKVHTTIPTVEGKIIDAKTNLPIENADIESSDLKIKSDQNGQFTLTGKKELGIGTLMGGLWRIQHIFRISKKGYHSLSCQCDILNTKEGCFNIKVPLKKVNQKWISYQNNGLFCF